MHFRSIPYELRSEVYEKWWNKELDRPIMSVTLSPPGLYSRGELLEFVYDLSLPAAEVAKRYEENFSRQDFLGDAYPAFYVRTTGLLGVFMGQSWAVSPKEGTVWYEKIPKEPEELEFAVDTQHPMYLRTMELVKTFQEYFQGAVVLGGANLGGVCDIYHSVRGMENAIFDLADEPEMVVKSMNQIYGQWMKTNNEILSLIDPKINHGYTHWTNILSRVPYDMIQADLAFLLGGDDYDEYLHPLIVRESQAFERSMFHMDGPGFLRHVDKLLEIPSLNGVQWIPGAGVEPVGNWPELYEKVSSSDKLLQVYIEGAQELPMAETILGHFSNPSRVCLIMSGRLEDKEQFTRFLEKHGF